MKLKPLGELGVCVSAIGQGTMGLGGRFRSEAGQDRECADALRLGLDLGMAFIDTAEVYGDGHAEEIVGAAIRGRREEAFIATKVSPEHLGYPDVLAACDRSLQRLGVDRIDLYQVHWPNSAIPLEETMRALIRLVKQGKVRAVGVSNFSPKQCQEAARALGETPLVSNQVEYNLFDRTIEDALLRYCQELKLTVIAYSPLDQGAVLPGGAGDRLLGRLANKYERTRAQIALSWLIRYEGVVAIPKALRSDHLRDNAAAMDLELAPEDAQAIDEAFQTCPIEVQTDRIKVVLDGVGNHQVYQTIEDALRNALDFTPSPAVLAEDIRRRDEPLKPVRVRQSQDASGRYDYDLIEGRIRYWAWVIAYSGERPIPVLVRE